MKASEQILIWGTGGHAKVVADLLNLSKHYDIAGYIDDAAETNNDDVFGKHKILGSRNELPRLHAQGIRRIVIAIGNCAIRTQLVKEAQQQGWILPVLIHPQAIVADSAEIEDGTVVCAGAVIGPACHIASGCIINTSATVTHDCEIGQGTHLCPGVQLAGHVSIGEETWVGIGSTIIEKVSIGSHAFIGAGSIVLKNIPSQCRAWGVPATIQSE